MSKATSNSGARARVVEPVEKEWTLGVVQSEWR